jgi:hypothetical protein
MRAFMAPCTLALVLAACHPGPPEPPPNTTPDGAVLASIVLTRKGDFDGLMRNLLPPNDYGIWRREWDRARTHPPQATPAKRSEFAQTMRMLTAPDAEQTVLEKIRPELADLRTRRGQQLPVLGAILQASGRQVISGAHGLAAGQKQMAEQALAALTGWMQGVDFGDENHARQAIGVLCDTARKLDVKTLDQWRALDYAQAMQRYGAAWRGLVAVLKVYGLDLDASLGAANVETLSSDGSHARVQVTLTLAGKAITGQWQMVKVGNAWYDAEQLAAWRKRHPPKPAPAASATATPPAAPATVANPPAPPRTAATAATVRRTPGAASPAPAGAPASAATAGARH